ncbi:MAG: macro domain-containing protein [Lachnospiraceae bacterium]|nr:macro domain-containing protein [Lachnospiraceae bacterium]
MPIHIVRNDITKMECDAIVNATNPKLTDAGGGVDAAIHRAAGPGLDEECRRLGGCRPGQAKLTGGYDLPCKYVIHTVGPHWLSGSNQKKKILESCYREALRVAAEQGCETVAFPLIATGTLGFPKDQALQIAISEISRFLLTRDMLVWLVVYDKDSFQVSKKLIEDVTEYIDECYVEAHYVGEETVLSTRALDSAGSRRLWEWEEKQTSRSAEKPPTPNTQKAQEPLREEGRCLIRAPMEAVPSPNLQDMLKQLDESFSQMLLRKIDEKGMTDAECYKKANVDRKLFSKIRSNVNYRPSKTTAIAFAIALELPYDEAKDMLMKAGFALSHSSKFDIIIEYFIRNGIYDIFQINEVLFEFDQSLLGM